MGRGVSHIARRAAAALLIRRAVAPLLLHGIADAARWEQAATAGEEAWRLFLRVERCALPLQRALAREPSAAPADAPFRAILAGVAQREAARVLVVRSHLRTAAGVAAARDVRVVVLKGGVQAIGDDPVDLCDLDLLITADQAAGFAAALQDQGWRATGETSDEVGQSLVARDVRLEIHHRLGAHDEGVWDRSEPLEATPPLRRLGPIDNLRHVVRHVAIDHPNRRLRLRDLILIAHAARLCRATEVASAYPEFAPTYEARVCREALDTAVRPPDGDAVPEGERRALAAYVLAARPPLRFVPREASEFVDLWTVSMLQTAWERRQIWAGARATSLRASSRPYIRAVEQRSATLGRAWRVTARAAYRGATWVVARSIAARARRTVEQACESSGLSRH